VTVHDIALPLSTVEASVLDEHLQSWLAGAPADPNGEVLRSIRVRLDIRLSAERAAS
jgi:hypothetical protein